MDKGDYYEDHTCAKKVCYKKKGSNSEYCSSYDWYLNIRIIRYNPFFNFSTKYFIKIEVKTTASKADTEFFVTKNELEVSKEYKKSYFIYRVYDAKGLYPKFYRAAGCIYIR